MDGHQILRLAAFIGAAFSIGLGAIGPALGAGFAGAEGCKAMGKKKEAQFLVLKTMLISMAIASGNGIFALMISLMLLYVAT